MNERGIGQECERAGETFQPYYDWGIAERQADDRARAEAKEPQRHRREWAEPGRDHRGDYPEASIVINTTGRWSGNQGSEERTSEKENGGGGPNPMEFGRGGSWANRGRTTTSSTTGKSQERRGEGNMNARIEKTAMMESEWPTISKGRRSTGR